MITNKNISKTKPRQTKQKSNCLQGSKNKDSKMHLEILMQASKQANETKCLKMLSKQANKLDTFTKNSENRLKKYLPKGDPC